MNSNKKSEKQRAKFEKKALKADIKAEKKSESTPSTVGPSLAVRYAELVRGSLYVLTGISIFIAIVLGQRGAIISLNDLIDSLFAATVGKIVLVLIGLALLIYGFKHLRIVR